MGTGIVSIALLLDGQPLLSTIVLALALWCLTMVWLPALLLCEGLRPRLRYGVRRWSTVFPLGMYAACSFVVGAVAKLSGITSFARVWVWIAFAVWVPVLAAMVGRAPALRHISPVGEE
ncbi:MAG: hypothetical protein KGL16_07405 [Acidobacteriota bacterium]|nr:hypothetical protein [Acidobacteriota bacterium]